MKTTPSLALLMVGALWMTPDLARGQIYSENAVGYVSVTIDCTTIVANPLISTTPANQVNPAVILPSAANLSKLRRWDPYAGSSGNWRTPPLRWYSSFEKWYSGGAPATDTIPLGEAFTIIPHAGSTPFVITFVGEVPQGNLSHNIPGQWRWSLQASEVPQAGRVQTDLGYPTAEDDEVHVLSCSAATAYAYDPFGMGWDPSEPLIQIASGFWCRKAAVASWTRTFHPLSSSGSVGPKSMLPHLTIMRDSVNTAIVSWPYSFTGWVLEECAVLVGPWQTVAGAAVPYPIGNPTEWRYTLPLNAAARFFRIKH